MKKKFLFIILLCALISCQDNVTFNSPAFQAQKDNVLWRAVDYKATRSSGSLTIQGFTSNETVTLKTNSPNLGTYVLGINVLNTATYSITDTSGTITYTAGNGVGEGQIVITDYDTVDKTVTGTFKFKAVNNSLINPNLNFQYGNFYKVSFK
jgi:hypothetical protein